MSAIIVQLPPPEERLKNAKKRLLVTGADLLAYPRPDSTSQPTEPPLLLTGPAEEPLPGKGDSKKIPVGGYTKEEVRGFEEGATGEMNDAPENRYTSSKIAEAWCAWMGYRHKIPPGEVVVPEQLLLLDCQQNLKDWIKRGVTITSFGKVEFARPLYTSESAYQFIWFVKMEKVGRDKMGAILNIRVKLADETVLFDQEIHALFKA